MALLGDFTSWERGSRISRIAHELDGFGVDVRSSTHVAGTRKSDHKSHCVLCRQTTALLLPLVREQDPTFTFCDRRGNPKPLRRQYGIFAALVREVHEHIVGSSNVTEAPEGLAWEENEPVAIEDPIVVPPPSTPESFDATAEIRKLYVAHKRCRAEIIRRMGETSDPIDSLAYRPLKDGVRMIGQGIPARACLHAMTLDWDDAVRAQFGIESYDPETEFPGGVSAYVDALVDARVLIMLVGEAGVGKSYWAKDLAERRFGDVFASLSCTEGATPGWLLGSVRIDGYHTSRFVEIWRTGGVFLFDEFDAMDANYAIMLNDALANDWLDNPVSGERIKRHPDTIIIAAANTFGDGASRQFVRNELDSATRDRFRMGRVIQTYADSIARKICGIALDDTSV